MRGTDHSAGLPQGKGKQPVVLDCATNPGSGRAAGSESSDDGLNN
jgi:hypothetical protein